MPKTSSPSLRPLRGALAGLALVALAPAAGAAPRALTPRAAVVKHTGRELAAGTPVERLVVKFQEGSRVRLRDGALAALTKATEHIAEMLRSAERKKGRPA